jgi:hypothetical protein
VATNVSASGSSLQDWLDVHRSPFESMHELVEATAQSGRSSAVFVAGNTALSCFKVQKN